MDAIGIYLKDNCWTAAHLKSSVFGLKTVRRFVLDQDTKEGRAEGLISYIAQKGIKAPKVALALPRSAYLAKTAEIPAPTREAAEGVVKFEMDRFFPFPADEVYFSSFAASRSGNLFFVYTAAAKKTLVDAEVEVFRNAGLDVSSVCIEQAALLDGLEFSCKADSFEDAVLVAAVQTELTIDRIKNRCPAYSRTLGRPAGGGLDSVIRELRMIPGRKSARTLAVSDEASTAEKLASMVGASVVDLKGIPIASVIATGAALAPHGAAGLKIDLAPSASADKNLPLTFKLVALAASLLVVLGASYITRDLVTLKRLDTALAAFKSGQEEAGPSSSHGKALERMDESNTKTLEVLNELSEVLPPDTWLTSFEYDGKEAVIEGLSSSAPGVVLKLEKSGLLSDVEFDSPITKRDGKEAFRLKCKVRPGSSEREAI